MKKLIFFQTVAALLILIIYNCCQWGNVHAQEFGAGPQIVNSSPSSITLKYVVADFDVTQIQTTNGAFDQIEIDGATQQSLADQPRLPIASTTIGIPTGAAVDLEVTTVETETLTGRYRIPSTTLALSQDLPDNLFGGELSELTVQEKFVDLPTAATSHSSHRPVTLGKPSMIREQQILQVQFAPVSYDSADQSIIIYRRIVAKISWNTPALQAAAATKAQSPHFESVLKETVLNYQQLHRGSIAAAAPLRAASIITEPKITTDTLKITIGEAGFHRIDYNALQTEGFNLAADPQDLQMMNKGQEIAIWVQGEEDGTLDAGDAIIFYAEAHDTVYSGENIYWLSNGDAQGLRMAEDSGAPDGTNSAPDRVRQSLHAEVNNYYWLTMPDGEGQDHWFWEGRQTAPVTTTRVITITSPITGTDAAGLTAELRVTLKGGTNDPQSPDHHTRILLNGVAVEDQYWNGLARFTHTAVISQSLLNDGPNTITIQSLGVVSTTVDQFFLDWIELDYWKQNRATDDLLSFPASGNRAEFGIDGFSASNIQLFDIQNPAAARRITDFAINDTTTATDIRFAYDGRAPAQYLALSESKYLAPAQIALGTTPRLKSAANGADYILITHRDFLTRTTPLAEHRQAQGLRVVTATTTEIFDEFNNGIFDPQAIRNFLAYAYENWAEPAPTYVMLVGDGTQDYRDYFGTSSINFVPSQIIETVELGQTPSDNWFVQISGADVLPDMLIGRLSAQVPAEVTEVVQKIIDYETSPPDDSWNNSVLFIADDDTSSFANTSDQLSALLPTDYTINRIDLKTYRTGDDPTTDINTAINSGALFTNYTGHGAANRWGDWGNDLSIYRNDDVDSLTNKGKETILTAANCLNGFFTGFQTSLGLAEKFQRHDNGGAVAVWAPSNLFYPSAHRALLTEFYGELYQEETVTLGAATTKAKISTHAQSNSWDELVTTFILFGDPATSLEPVLPEQFMGALLPFVNKGE